MYNIYFIPPWLKLNKKKIANSNSSSYQHLTRVLSEQEGKNKIEKVIIICILVSLSKTP